jgi:hypothetical protein
MTIQPPRAQRIPSVRELHGHTDVDNYAWMRESDAPDFLTHLAAERAYYEAQTAGLAGLTDELFCEAVARTPEAAEDSVGWTLRGYRYWHRTPAKAENRQLFRATPGQMFLSPSPARMTGSSRGWPIPQARRYTSSGSPRSRLAASCPTSSTAPILAGRGRATASISSISCPTS